MKRWAVLVVVLYFLIFVALTSPFILVAFYPHMTARDALSPFPEWIYWVGVGVMLAAQAVMLIVPVELSLGRPTSRRSVLWTILVSGLMVGVLGVGAVVSIDEFIRKEKAGTSEAALPWAVLLVVWAAWTTVFYRCAELTHPPPGG